MVYILCVEYFEGTCSACSRCTEKYECPVNALYIQTKHGTGRIRPRRPACMQANLLAQRLEPHTGRPFFALSGRRVGRPRAKNLCGFDIDFCLQAHRPQFVRRRKEIITAAAHTLVLFLKTACIISSNCYPGGLTCFARPTKGILSYRLWITVFHLKNACYF